MKVSDIMTPHVITVSPGTTIRGLWKYLFSKHLNALPVVDTHKKIKGIITKENLLEALYPDYQEYFEDITEFQDFEDMEKKVKELGDKKAEDIMSRRVIFTHAHTPIMRALSRMIVRRVNQLPVLSESRTVVGMVTKGDIFYALVKSQSKSSKKRT